MAGSGRDLQAENQELANQLEMEVLKRDELENHTKALEESRRQLEDLHAGVQARYDASRVELDQKHQNEKAALEQVKAVLEREVDLKESIEVKVKQADESRQRALRDQEEVWRTRLAEQHEIVEREYKRRLDAARDLKNENNEVMQLELEKDLLDLEKEKNAEIQSLQVELRKTREENLQQIADRTQSRDINLDDTDELRRSLKSNEEELAVVSQQLAALDKRAGVAVAAPVADEENAREGGAEVGDDATNGVGDYVSKTDDIVKQEKRKRKKEGNDAASTTVTTVTSKTGSPDTSPERKEKKVRTKSAEKSSKSGKTKSDKSPSKSGRSKDKDNPKKRKPNHVVIFDRS